MLRNKDSRDRVLLVADLNFAMMRRFIHWKYRKKSSRKLEKDIKKFKRTLTNNHKVYDTNEIG